MYPPPRKAHNVSKGRLREPPPLPVTFLADLEVMHYQVKYLGERRRCFESLVCAPVIEDDDGVSVLATVRYLSSTLTSTGVFLKAVSAESSPALCRDFTCALNPAIDVNVCQGYKKRRRERYDKETSTAASNKKI